MVALTAASRDRAWPPKAVKKPPTYSVLPLTAIDCTRLFVSGANPGITAPVCASSATTRWRFWFGRPGPLLAW